jgi:hypothetical protein
MLVFCLLGTEKESGRITSDSGVLSGHLRTVRYAKSVET